jgi:integrase/recombinase XerD
MQASKIIYKREPRIKVDFPYNQEIAALIKQIPGSKWSKTLGTWHIPYSSTAFNQLKMLLPQIEYPNKSVQDTDESHDNTTPVRNSIPYLGCS